MPWMAADRSLPDYMDIRDDRVVFFTSLDNGSKRSFYYSARAVTRGDFVLPHVTAEAMYDPSVRALAGAGRVKVNARGN